MADLGKSIRDALVDFLSPLQEAAQDPGAMIEWLATLGQTEAIAADPALLQIAQGAAALVEKLSAFDAETLDSWVGISGVLDMGEEAAEIRAALRQFAVDPARAQVAGALAEEVMALLLASYLRRRHGTFFRVAALLTLIEPRETSPADPPLLQDGRTLRYARLLDRFKFGAVSDLVSHPGPALAEAYFPNDLAAASDAWSAAAGLYPHLAFLADELGLAWRTAYPPVIAALPPPPSGDEPTDALTPRADPGTGEEMLPPPPPPLPDEYYAAHFPTFRLTLARSASGPEAEAAVELLTSSARHPGSTAGYILRAVGSLNMTVSTELWRLALSATGQVPAFVVTRAGFQLAPNALPVSGGAAKLLLERLASAGSSGPDFVFGSTEGSRLELGSVSLEGGLLYDPARKAATLAVTAAQCSFVIAPGDGDGFVSRVLPAGGVKAGFDLALAWSSDRGLSFGGAAGLETDLPVGVSIGGLVTVPTIHLGLKASDAGLQAEVSAVVGASIGPVSAVIDRIGFTGTLTFPDDGGNLGPADLALDFKGPSGVGVTIDAVAVTGGGFLRNEGNGQYSGVIELSLQGGIAVKGLGLIATRLPDGGKGYSLLVIITAEGFGPIPLPLGFRLTGIGGLLGVNRTFAEDVLRAGLKSHALDSVMFPQDPVRNAPQILSNLNRIFPPAPDHYLFGPVVQIEWGVPTLLTAQVAVVLEFGVRLRLLVLAQIAAILPKPEQDLIRLQMDAIGVVDFDQGTAAIDASLYDSRLLQKFVLTGDMALRLKWSAPPAFALAVGGLHPAFNPPPGFPKLARIAINLAAGDNPRIRCEAYFALTGSSIQFGARAELYAAAAGFSIQGEIGFDVLIQRDPFAFLAEFLAQVQLKRGSSNLFKVRVEGALAGPRPLHIKAKATFEILWWDVSVRVDRTLVGGETPPLPAPVDVLPLLLQALRLAASWSARLPAGQRQAVTLRPRPELAGEVLLHPLGLLVVSQTVVPLNLDIARFGDAAPAGARRFTVRRVTPSGQVETPDAVPDFFAPAQFLEMSDDEKLSRPSFESLPAGVRLGAGGFAFSASPTEWLEVPAIQFETIIVGQPEPPHGPPPPPPPLYNLPAVLLAKQARFGAAANSDLRRTGTAKYRTVTEGKHRMAKEGWSIVAEEDLAVQTAPGVAGRPASYSEAEQALAELKQAEPAKARDLKILRLSEVRG